MNVTIHRVHGSKRHSCGTEYVKSPLAEIRASKVGRCRELRATTNWIKDS